MSTLDAIETFGTALSLQSFLVGMLVSVLVGVVVSIMYKSSQRGISYDPSFVATLVLTGAIVSVMIMFIGSNPILSLGMVGALSIIRFRTVIKDSQDMTALLWMIAVGLGCGTYNYIYVIIGTLIFLAVSFVLRISKFPIRLDDSYILTVSGKGDCDNEQIKSTAKQFSTHIQMRSFDAQDDHWEYVFEIKSLKDGNETECIKAIKAIKGVEKISLLAPQLAIPV